ncbi:MAG: glutaredoxin 3 [Phenylobacterium sp.]|jgi:glutaredoxin 3
MAEVELYTNGSCPFCFRAKALLNQKNVEFIEIRIDQHPELRATMIERANGGYTVPQIFINQQHIGGCDEMMRLEVEGRLDALL